MSADSQVSIIFRRKLFSRHEPLPNSSAMSICSMMVRYWNIKSSSQSICKIDSSNLPANRFVCHRNTFQLMDFQDLAAVPWFVSMKAVQGQLKPTIFYSFDMMPMILHWFENNGKIHIRMRELERWERKFLMMGSTTEEEEFWPEDTTAVEMKWKWIKIMRSMKRHWKFMYS